MPPVTIHPLVPDFILQQFRAGVRRGEFSGVGMFVDISGFSKMTDTLMTQGQHGAEVLATVMRAVFTPLIQTVHEHEGFIATLAGDAFTALFPFERAVDAGPVCAEVVQAAWEIQQQMAANTVQITPYGTYHITAKTGVAAGEVSWGIITSEDDGQAAYYFRGSAVEDCAEIEHAASAGEIILDALVCEQAPAHAQVKPHGNYFRLTGMDAADDPDTGGFLERGPLALPTGPGETVLFFPESLVTQEHTGEFRQVVNLFVQMPTIRTDIELEVFMRALFSLQNRYGGLLNRVDFGDKGAHLLMFWGAPVAYQNDIGRAVNFVLELQTRTSLPFTAGLTYRISHAGFIGSPLREEYTCYGRGVNLAARFMTAAPRGDVWVDEEIARRVGNYFELETLGQKTFKGFSEPQQVYQLIERKEQTASSFQGAFVGRQEELAQLVEFVRPLAEGRFAGALVLSGEAGIGKSRLVSAFQSSPFVRDMQPAPLWALCQNDQILHESLNPFRYWLRQYFEQSALQGEARNKRNFSRKLDELAAATAGASPGDAALANELERTRSFLGALLDLHWPDSLYEQLEGQARFDNTLIGLATLLQAESLRQPVILLIEDAQWLDADSRTFIPRLVRTLTAGGRAVPLAILAAVRLESGGQAKGELLGEGVEYQEMVLRAFGRGDLETQAAAVLGATADEGLVKLLVERAEGNPFFAEQILRYLLENHDLTQGEDGRFGVRRSLLESKTAFLPTDVRALLVARLDQLTRALRDLVQAASVLGREFEVRVLIGMLRDDAQVAEGVQSGEDAAIWSAISQLRYLFRHALLRDAAYRTQVRTRRRTLHRLAVEALELLYFENLAPRYGELGYHAEQAELTEKARDYLHKGGDAAKEAYQNSEAVDYYTRALALTPVENRMERFELLFSREEIYHRQGDREVQVQDLAALEELASELNDTRKQVEVALKGALMAEEKGDYSNEIVFARRAVSLAEGIGDDNLRARGHLKWGAALHWQGDYSGAEKESQQALILFQARGNRLREGDAFYNLGLILTEQREYTSAEKYLLQALEISREMKDIFGEAAALNMLGLIGWHRKEYGTALDYYEQALEIYQKIGRRRGECTALNNQGTIYHVLGIYDAALRYYEKSLSISRQIGSRQEEAILLNNLGEIHLKKEEYELAKRFFAQALEIKRAIGNRFSEAYTIPFYGEALFALEEWFAAESAFERALSLREELGLVHSILFPKLGIIRLAYQRGDQEKATKELEELIPLLSIPNHVDNLDDPFNFYWVCYQLLKTNQDFRAEEVLETAYRLLQDQAAKILGESSRLSFLQNVPEHRKIIQAFEKR